MLNPDRDTIELNIGGLVRATDYKRLMECCLEQRILFDVMREKIERTNDTEPKRHRALFHKLMRRGPDAFAALQQLCEREFPAAVRFLDNEVSLRKGGSGAANAQPAPAVANRPTAALPARTHASAVPVPPKPPGIRVAADRTDATGRRVLAEFTDALPPATAFDRVRHSTEFHGNGPNDISCYPMHSPNRGVALLVNIINFQSRPGEPRNGADVDKVNLVQLFRQMGFKVMYYEDLTAGGLRHLLNELRNSRWLRSTDCFVMALMTHGTMVNGRGKVEFADKSFLDLKDVLDYFRNARSEALLHKPKVFLFPFCRGSTLEKPLGLQRKNTLADKRISTDAAVTAVDDDEYDDSDAIGVAADDDDGSSAATAEAARQNIPESSDMKICYATGPGFEAMREPDTGSWYIESMCGIWARHAHDKSLDDLLKMVGESQLNKKSLHGNIQTAHNEDCGFFKKLYFNPGYYGPTTTATMTNDVTAQL